MILLLFGLFAFYVRRLRLFGRYGLKGNSAESAGFVCILISLGFFTIFKGPIARLGGTVGLSPLETLFFALLLQVLILLAVFFYFLAEYGNAYKEGAEAAPDEGPGKKSTLREYADAILIAGVLAVCIRSFVVQAFKIPSGSMEDTLLVGDHILVNRFVYGLEIPYLEKKIFAVSGPRRGDIVVFRYPADESKDFIKRVVGTPGDVVQVINKKVYINGKPITEPYTVYKDEDMVPRSMQPRDNFGPVTVPAHSFFMMGDNRDRSLDSRFWGFVKDNKIVGKALFIYWSWDGEQKWARWSRLGHVVK